MFEPHGGKLVLYFILPAASFIYLEGGFLSSFFILFFWVCFTWFRFPHPSSVNWTQRYQVAKFEQVRLFWLISANILLLHLTHFNISLE